jgi:hypothetical protein
MEAPTEDPQAESASKEEGEQKDELFIPKDN